MNDKIKELIRLSLENPELDIITMVDAEVVPNHSSPRWGGKIEKVEKDICWFSYDEIIVSKDSIIKKIRDYADSELDLIELSAEDFEAELEKEFNRLIDSGEIKEAIIIYIGV